MKRVLYEIEIATRDKERGGKALLSAIRAFTENYDPSICSAVLATKVHLAVYKTLGKEDLYRELKKRSNDVALSLLPKIEERVKSAKDPLKIAMLCSIIGNMLDFGIEGGSGSPEELIDAFDLHLSEGLGYDDYDEVRNILSTAREINFIADNCGEIVFDKILCRELKNFNPGLKITLVVRGTPVLSDATLEDARGLGFGEVVDRILTTGTFAVGVDFVNIPEELKQSLDKGDLIICKGMANYEALSETDYRPVLYLLRTKCTPVSRSMNLPFNASAIKLYR
jgi:hypothetical protein